MLVPKLSASPFLFFRDYLFECHYLPVEFVQFWRNYRSLVCRKKFTSSPILSFHNFLLILDCRPFKTLQTFSKGFFYGPFRSSATSSDFLKFSDIINLICPLSLSFSKLLYFITIFVRPNKLRIKQSWKLYLRHQRIFKNSSFWLKLGHSLIEISLFFFPLLSFQLLSSELFLILGFEPLIR